jgi:hypothetical protein
VSFAARDVCWHFQLGYEAAPGVPLSLSTHVGSSACFASFHVSYLLLLLDSSLLVDVLDIADGRSAQRSADPAPPEPLGDCSGASQLLAAAQVRCGMNGAAPALEAAAHSLGALRARYAGLVTRDMWLRRCRQLLRFLRGMIQSCEEAPIGLSYRCKGAKGAADDCKQHAKPAAKQDAAQTDDDDMALLMPLLDGASVSTGSIAAVVEAEIARCASDATWPQVRCFQASSMSSVPGCGCAVACCSSVPDTKRMEHGSGTHACAGL